MDEHLPVDGSDEARERHKLAERERRKSMRELFLTLHALLPHAGTVRKEQYAILDEIIKYIPLAAARLRSLQSRRDARARPRSSSSSPTLHVSELHSSATGGDCDIRVAPEPASSVAVRVRGDRVNVSLSDSKGSSSSSSHGILLSALFDELDAHGLELSRSTHCRDGSKLLHHSESKIAGGLDRSLTLLKARLQDLACKLHRLRKPSTPSSLKRSFDQMQC